MKIQIPGFSSNLGRCGLLLLSTASDQGRAMAAYSPSVLPSFLPLSSWRQSLPRLTRRLGFCPYRSLRFATILGHGAGG